jgi:hypothetical protein
MIRLYTVPTYSLPASDFDSHSDILTVDDIVEQLETDHCFHFRIHPATRYIFFGDLDNYPKDIDSFINLLHNFMASRYNLHFDRENDFKYTRNTAKPGSYHYSIPKWNLTTEKLKEIHNDFLSTFPNELVISSGQRKVNCVDTTIYSEHWFRCPNQSKGVRNAIGVHAIIFGSMEDFIVEYIPSNSIDINNIHIIASNGNNASNPNNTISNIPIVSNTNAAANINLASNNTGSNSPMHTNTDANTNSIIHIEQPNNIIPSSNTSSNNTSIPSARNGRNRASTLEEQDNILSKMISKVEIFKKLFDECYKPIRFTDYNNWIQVGMAIKNTIPDTYEAIDLYIYYSARATNFAGNQNVIDKFNSFKKTNNGLGIGTIYKMALDDNKENAIKILGNNKLQLLTQDYCRFIKAIAGNKYFYRIYGESNYKLYCYNGRYWESNVVRLREFIGQELYDFLRQILVDVYWFSLGRDFQSYKDKLDRLNSLSFKNDIIETYKEYNSRNDITFDDKWWLLGFNNIVYDMKACHFREYEYDDYITITTGYDWREPTDTETATMHQFIKCIMPVESEREAFLTILATGLDGRCIEKFIIFNGDGGNGKGVIDDLMLAMLGKYGFMGNNNLLFEHSKMGSNPEKANIHQKRFIVFREPSAKKKFENAVIKELTGGGKISARGHFETDTEKELCNTLICECNKKPAFSEELTQADFRRIIDIYFRATFTDVEELVDPANYIYLANPYYKTTEFIQSHKYALFKILIEYHRKFLHEQNSLLKMPDTIIHRTKLYLENNCDLVQWFRHYYRQDEPDTEEVSYLRLSEIHEFFLHSDEYKNLSRTNQQQYTKIKFFQLVRNNLFFKNYYVENRGSLRCFIKGWYKCTEVDL